MNFNVFRDFRIIRNIAQNYTYGHFMGKRSKNVKLINKLYVIFLKLSKLNAEYEFEVKSEVRQRFQ